MPPLACQAVEDNNLDSLKDILKLMDVNKGDGEGVTVLHKACELGRKDIVLYLLEIGADAATVDHFGHTPLHLAVKHRHIDIILILRRVKFPVSISPSLLGMELVRAVKKRDMDQLRDWCMAGVDMDQADYENCTAMQKAEELQDIEIVRLLLYCGATPVSGLSPTEILPLHEPAAVILTPHESAPAAELVEVLSAVSGEPEPAAAPGPQGAGCEQRMGDSSSSEEMVEPAQGLTPSVVSGELESTAAPETQGAGCEQRMGDSGSSEEMVELAQGLVPAVVEEEQEQDSATSGDEKAAPEETPAADLPSQPEAQTAASELLGQDGHETQPVEDEQPGQDGSEHLPAGAAEAPSQARLSRWKRFYSFFNRLCCRSSVVRE
ncbi:uncharacterized protein LOC136755193 [Amia ocellicauda]|uniref:uncharacterized protein LOC136755193 n=1 Tax=Amia ocellicauda TaxID=2972642 RepID=UPI0034639852